MRALFFFVCFFLFLPPCFGFFGLFENQSKIILIDGNGSFDGNLSLGDLLDVNTVGAVGGQVLVWDSDVNFWVVSDINAVDVNNFWGKLDDFLYPLEGESLDLNNANIVDVNNLSFGLRGIQIGNQASTCENGSICIGENSADYGLINILLGGNIVVPSSNYFNTLIGDSIQVLGDSFWGVGIGYSVDLNGINPIVVGANSRGLGNGVVVLGHDSNAECADCGIIGTGENSVDNSLKVFYDGSYFAGDINAFDINANTYCFNDGSGCLGSYPTSAGGTSDGNLYSLNILNDQNYWQTNIKMPDNVGLYAGTQLDTNLYHDGTSTYLVPDVNNNTKLIIQASNSQTADLLKLDQSTVPYAGDPSAVIENNVLFEVNKKVSGTGVAQPVSNISSHLIRKDFDFNYGISGATVRTIFGNVTDIVDMDVTSDLNFTTGATSSEYNFGRETNVNREGDISVNRYYLTQYGNTVNSSILSGLDYDYAGGNFQIENIGSRVNALCLPTLSNGTMTSTNIGQYVTVGTNTSGTSTSYGLYVDVGAVADNQYSAWFDAYPFILAGDNTKFFWGAAQDASIYYDGIGNAFVINPREVGSGQVRFLGNTEHYAAYTAYFRDTSIGINSGSDGHLDLFSDGQINYGANAHYFGDGAGSSVVNIFDTSTNQGSYIWNGVSDQFIFADDVNITNDLIVKGNLSVDQNVTIGGFLNMNSPDGNTWACKPTNGGDFNCSLT